MFIRTVKELNQVLEADKTICTDAIYRVWVVDTHTKGLYLVNRNKTHIRPAGYSGFCYYADDAKQIIEHVNEFWEHFKTGSHVLVTVVQPGLNPPYMFECVKHSDYFKENAR